MAKKAPFFSHDMNARHDPKISAMRGVYGAEGYGWFWMLVEMMAEADGYQLDRKSKYAFNAYAMQLQCKPDMLLKFVSDCIDEFELFGANESYFWSNSLRKRMQYRDAVSEKRAAAAQKRWEKKPDNANASYSDANAMQNDANKTKQNKTKLNKYKEIISSHTQNQELADALIAFIEFRHNIKAKMTDRALNLLLGELDKLSSVDAEKIAILNQSIMNGWKSVYALKKQTASVVPIKPIDKELDYRRREIAFNQWVDKGNDPNEFRWHG